MRLVWNAWDVGAYNPNRTEYWAYFHVRQKVNPFLHRKAE